MKNIIIAFFLMLAPVGVTAQYQKAQEKAPLVNVPLENFASQQKVLFNFGWKFQLVTNENKNTDFASPVLDDSSWRTLDLPHDFQFEQPCTENGGGARGFKPMCEGWYRKSFPTDPSWKGKRVVLDFGGIIYLGDVYLNGTKIASTDYGYVGLEADLTPFLRHDGDWTQERFTLVHGRRSVPRCISAGAASHAHRSPRGVYHHPRGFLLPGNGSRTG